MNPTLRKQLRLSKLLILIPPDRYIRHRGLINKNGKLGALVRDHPEVVRDEGVGLREEEILLQGDVVGPVVDIFTGYCQVLVRGVVPLLYLGGRWSIQITGLVCTFIGALRFRLWFLGPKNGRKLEEEESQGRS